MSKEKTKISLSGVGINKEDILKKFISNVGDNSSTIVHKNVEIKHAAQETNHHESDNRDFHDHAIHSNIPHKIQRIKQKNITTNVKIPAKLEIKIEKSQPEKKHQEKEEITIFGTKSLGDDSQSGIVIKVENDPEEEIAKEDHRDKTIIEKHLRHFKYLEFDSESEIDSLRSGENLREMLSKQRKQDENEDIEIVSDFIAEEKVFRKKKSNPLGAKKKQKTDQYAKQVREIQIPDLISLVELANRLSLKVSVIIDQAKNIGEIIDEDAIIDGDVAELLVEELGHKVLRVKEKTAEDVLSRKAANTKLQTVPPIVTVMGHVDHGKTSLLDALRQTDVALGEAGGITQAIGAYQITLVSGRKITFIDTPGHEAFTAMRARGANATNIIVLVIAADDSVNTQTIEAIQHAKAAKCPIIVAVNKMDLPSANLQKVKEDILTYDLVPEDFGGDIAVIPVSALKKTGLKELEEQILLNADMLELKANYAGHAGGVVLESRLDNKKGVVATVLIKHGLLHHGDVILAGTTFGRVRKMVDDKSQNIMEAFPSMPVEVYGFTDVPQAGERFFVLESEKSARDVISHRIERQRSEEFENRTNEDPFAKLLKQEKKEINIIVRCDTQGSVDAIKYSLSKIQHNDIKLNIVHALVGNVTEADVLLAKTNKATIFAFNVSVGSNEESLARKNGIAVREHSIIYKIIDEIRVLLSQSLEPVIVETKVGSASVKQVFDVSKVGKIAGLMVQDGVVKRGSLAKVIRGGTLIAQGNIRTLKHFQEDVKSVQQGKECGMQVEKFEDFQAGDIIEIYDITYQENKI